VPVSQALEASNLSPQFFGHSNLAKDLQDHCLNTTPSQCIFMLRLYSYKQVIAWSWPSAVAALPFNPFLQYKFSWQGHSHLSTIHNLNGHLAASLFVYSYCIASYNFRVGPQIVCGPLFS
jgi:hypothetical protein